MKKIKQIWSTFFYLNETPSYARNAWQRMLLTRIIYQRDFHLYKMLNLKKTWHNDLEMLKIKLLKLNVLIPSSQHMT